MAQGQIDIESWMRGIRANVDAILERFFESKCEEASRLSSHAIELVTEVRDLTMRGGKRLRPIVTAAAYRAASGATDLGPTFEVGAALELLQTYLLIHDDWMDEDNERRGGPAVHYAFQQKHGHDHLGAKPSSRRLLGKLPRSRSSQPNVEARSPARIPRLAPRWS